MPHWSAPLLRAARILRAGGVIAYPTEGVWGLGCCADAEDAVRRILALKGRSEGQGLILIAADLEQLQGWIQPGEAELKRLTAPTDHPITWVVSAAPQTPDWLTGGRSTIAIRLISHPLAAALCRAAASPLISTSANRSGRPPARTALGVRWRFRGKLDGVLNGATGGRRRPSEIRDALSGRILRPG